MKRYIVLFAIAVFAVSAFPQYNDPVLITINGKEITRSEFQERYHKEAKGITMNQYLDQFIIKQLKLAEAESLGIDTTAAFISQLNAYQRNTTKSYFLQSVLDASSHQKARTTAGKRDQVYVEGLHIYKYLPQNTPASQVNRVERQMDSIYTAIRQNPAIDFNVWVNKYSHDKDTFRVCWLQMPEEFENVIYNLNRGEVSKPFFTPQGIHIVKVLDKKNGIPPTLTHNLNFKDLNDEAFINKVKAESGFKPNQDALDELQSKGRTNKTLFTLGGKSYTGSDFEYFSRDNTKNLKKRINDFVRKSLYDYENSKLNSGVLPTSKEYRENMLLSYIDRVVFSKVEDDKELEEYFNAHKKTYHWELPRYKGIVVHTKDKKTRKRIKKQLRKVPESDRMNFLHNTYNAASPDFVRAEQGTFAVAQNPFVDKMIFKVGRYIPLKTHPYTVLVGEKVKGPDSYHEIRDAVIIDYRNYLEERWISYLHKKSKVEINQEVLKTVNNH